MGYGEPEAIRSPGRAARAGGRVAKAIRRGQGYRLSEGHGRTTKCWRDWKALPPSGPAARTDAAFVEDKLLSLVTAAPMADAADPLAEDGRHETL